MSQRLLLGDEAVAQAVFDAGITTAYAYPGTPSTEAFEFVERLVKKDPSVHASWAANEKVAYEEAVGTSFAGRRTFVTMKHVGLNVAADPFMNSAITGADGGLVLMVADDPSMHSSQNEQDSRYYADFAMLPCYEPATQQEAYDMTREAYDLSERLHLPVLLRLVTRLAHSRSNVTTGPRREQNPLAPSTTPNRWTLLPTNARVNYDGLLAKQPELRKISNESAWNTLTLNPNNRKLGIITAGVAYNYVREALEARDVVASSQVVVDGVGARSPRQSSDDELPSILKIGLYPAPVDQVMALLEHVETVLIVEEGYPFLERTLLGEIGKRTNTRFQGRFTGHLPMAGELTPDLVAKALGKHAPSPAADDTGHVKARPPQLCPGCPHADTFNAMNDAKVGYQRPVVFSDIGCYTLGFYEPFNAIESCLDMGASISMAKGAADAGMHPVMCVIGDSTFGHSGMTPLLTAAHENTNMTVVIVDNGTVAMTGTQESLSMGQRLDEIVAGLGVPKEHLRVLNPHPKHRVENAAIIKEELEYQGLSVIIPRRACVQDKSQFPKKPAPTGEGA
jgi:indolepyruvate ferredoxin oxidoreductase alpha subunit